MLTENDKGRATFIIENQKVEEVINKELSNKERYKKLLRKENKTSIEQMKNLEQINPTTTIAQATLKAHKNPLKVRLLINTQESSFYKIAKFVSNELTLTTTTAKLFIKDFEQFVNKLKEITLEEGEKTVSFDIADMYQK